ncbi:MAG TPA: sulfate ABC transporter permease subunit CysT [Candidatus Binataceae bacterium]|nr:sulfate ABC transporter permease subunit CysT [Candidatus Binataceae bacterium]
MLLLKRKSILPGFGLSLGITTVYLSLIAVIPLSTIFLKTAQMSPAQFWQTVASARVLASFRLSFGASLIAAFVNSIFGLLVAWTMVRYSFPGRTIVDAMIDLPFALPTAVAGITLTTLCATNGWIGRYTALAGIKISYTPLGISIALIFVGLPFIIRTVEPVLEELDHELEEAAATLGAGRLQTFLRVILPNLFPAVLTGFALAFARAVGEYGSVVFIAGNMPMKTEIVPLLIMTRLEQFDYRGATAIALVMLLFSFALLLTINLLQRWTSRFYAQ